MEEEHKVIVVGLDNAGKTTILYQLSMNEVIHTRNGSKWIRVVQWYLLRKYLRALKTIKSPTIGSNVEEIVCKNVHFFMWDIGGQESLRSSWNTYFADSDFVIFVVDSTDRERLPISKMEERFYIDQSGLELGSRRWNWKFRKKAFLKSKSRISVTFKL